MNGLTRFKGLSILNPVLVGTLFGVIFLFFSIDWLGETFVSKWLEILSEVGRRWQGGPLWLKIVINALVVIMLLAMLKFFGDVVRNNPQRQERRRLKKKAKAALKKGDLSQAAKYFEGLHQEKKAIKLYIKANNYVGAADILQKKQQDEEALKLLDRAGEHERVALIYERRNDFLQAGETYARGQRSIKAADMFLKAKEWHKAAQCFSEVRNYSRAAELYLQADDKKAAAQCYEMAMETPSTEEKKKDVALHGSKLFCEVGEPLRAAALLVKVGHYLEAAEIEEDANAFSLSAEHWLQGGNPRRAAELFAKAGDQKRALLAKAQASEESKDFFKAGEYYAQGESFEKAAECFIKIHGHERAGQMYERSGKIDLAAECYVKAEVWEKAAELFERLQRYDEAAEYFMKIFDRQRYMANLIKAGRYFQAGKMALLGGFYEDAIILLQKELVKTPDSKSCGSLLGEAFFAQQQYNLATEAFRKVLGDQTPNVENIDTCYFLARSLEEMQDYNQAVSFYDKILVADYRYRDVQARSAVLGRILGRTISKVRSMPIFSEDLPALSQDAIPHYETTVITTGTSAEEWVNTPPIAKGGANQDKTNSIHQDECLSAQPSFKEIQQENSRYKILRELGRGGMGVVFLAQDVHLGRPVAYKMLSPEMAKSKAGVELFIREGKAAAVLNHPNIVTVYDAGRNGNQFFISMEFVEGLTLKEEINKKKQLPNRVIAAISRQICAALSYAHRNKIVHRDIKPSNIMISKIGHVKLMDFGIALVTKRGEKEKNMICGTPHYAAPEQISGRGSDHRSDIYALGITIYEMFAGEQLFEGITVDYYNDGKLKPVPYEKLKERIPTGVVEVILKAIQENPNERYTSVDDFARDLIQKITA